jgi:uncharacterized protein (DUF697 family)
MAGWVDGLSETLARQWRAVWTSLANPRADTRAAETIAASARRGAAVFWLLGKVQAGKTSIVRALTGLSAAEIGNGFTPCTRTARIFDFPAEAPVIRFLDTRGLGEAGYDPAEDLAIAESQAHVLLVVMKARDPQQGSVVDVVASIRLRDPEWPVVVAQTSLHESYAPGRDHILPYLYAASPTELLANPAIPADLARSLAFQRASFERLPGKKPIAFVPIDFTLPEDGYTPATYGMDALVAALREAAPAGLMSALRGSRTSINDALAAQAHPHVLGYATAAAAVDIFPVAGLVAVPGVQAKMLHSLARIYDVVWNRGTLAAFAGCFGTGAIVRLLSSMGIRQMAKLVPVYGQTAGAVAASASSFATTFALGKAACYFLARRRAGETDPEGVADAYKAALADAFRIARERHLDQKA